MVGIENVLLYCKTVTFDITENLGQMKMNVAKYN